MHLNWALPIGGPPGSRATSVRGSRAGTMNTGEVPSVAFAMPDVKAPINGHIPGQVSAAMYHSIHLQKVKFMFVEINSKRVWADQNINYRSLIYVS